MGDNLFELYTLCKTMSFEIDISKSVWENMPPRKRFAKRFELIQLYNWWFQVMNEEFLAFVEETRERIQLSCETIQMEWYLNKIFDPNFAANWPATKKIYIENAAVSLDEEYSFLPEEETTDEVYTFLPSEDGGLEADTHALYSFLPSEYEQDVDLTVYYSSDLAITNAQESQMEAYVKRYLFMGKKVRLEEYS